jgi:hypothetical protein
LLSFSLSFGFAFDPDPTVTVPDAPTDRWMIPVRSEAQESDTRKFYYIFTASFYNQHKIMNINETFYGIENTHITSLTLTYTSRK